jgi:predicted ATPase with chaperone activity
MGILAASGQIAEEWGDDLPMLGELALDGSVRPVRGVLPIALAAKAHVITPSDFDGRLRPIALPGSS